MSNVTTFFGDTSADTVPHPYSMWGQSGWFTLPRAWHVRVGGDGVITASPNQDFAPPVYVVKTNSDGTMVIQNRMGRFGGEIRLSGAEPVPDPVFYFALNDSVLGNTTQLFVSGGSLDMQVSAPTPTGSDYLLLIDSFTSRVNAVTIANGSIDISETTLYTGFYDYIPFKDILTLSVKNLSLISGNLTVS